LEVVGNEKTALDAKKVIVTRYYHNKTKGEPYITAEFKAEEFQKYEHFSVGNAESFSTKRRRRRSGITNLLAIKALTKKKQSLSILI
jgi:hypothetical protein